MSFMHRELDADIDRLVRESSMPKGLHYDKNYLTYSLNQTYESLTRPSTSVSSSATARLKTFSNASPLARFNAFWSPQVQLRRTDHLNESTQTVADLFNSLKKGAAVPASNNSSSVGNPAPRKVPVRSKGIRDFQETFVDCFDSEGNKTNQSTLDTQATGADDTLCDSNTEACSLFMWIIKPVPGLAAVRVEGKRSLTENEFWQSGIIKRRINEKVVETKNGSVYQLEGNMELLDAIAAGVSRKVAEAFWLGFPVDWQQLIEQHFCHGNYTREPGNTQEVRSTEEDEEICVVEACDDDDDDFNIEESCLNETDNLGIEMSEKTVEDSADVCHTEKITVESDTRSLVPEQRMSIKSRKTKETGTKDECVLTNWIIQPLPVGGGVHLLGLNQDGVMWNSSAIEKRLEKKKLVTSSGCVYRLKGSMDRSLALQNGIPEKIIEKFKTGFPKEWQELLQEIMVEGRSKRRTRSKTTPRVKSAKSESCHKKKTNSMQEISPTRKRKASSEKIIRNVKMSRSETKARSGKSKKALSSTMVHSRNTSLNSTVSECDRPKNVVLTPTCGFVDLENLKYSSRGRLIKPPLSWWAGQRIYEGEDGCFVKARTDYAHRYCQEIEDRVFNSQKRYRDMFFKQPKKCEDEQLSKTKLTPEKRRENKKMNSKTFTTAQTREEDVTKEKVNSKNRMENVNMDITKRKVNSKNRMESVNMDITKGKVNSKNRMENVNMDITKEKVNAKNRMENINMDITNEKVNSKNRMESVNMDITKEKVNSKNRTENVDMDITKEKVNSKNRLENVNMDITKEKVNSKNRTENVNLNSKTFTVAKAGRNKSVRIEGMTKGKKSPKKRLAYKEKGTKTFRGLQTGEDKIDNESFTRDFNKLETSVESSQSEKQEDSYPDLEKEIRIILTRSKLSGRSKPVKNLASPCYKNCTEKNQNASKNGELYSIEESDDGNCIDDKTPADAKEENVPSRKRPVKVNQVSVVLPTTGEQAEKGPLCPRKTRSSSLRSCTLTDEQTENWTAGERDRLNLAFKRISGMEENYWDKVAEFVQSRTAVECCQEFYRTEKVESTKKRKQSKNNEKPKTQGLTANRGTLKRKQQFHDILKQHSENHIDNLFEGTPFRKAKKGKMSRMRELEGEDFFEESSKRQGKSRFQTPKGNIEDGRRVMPQFASAKKTPASNVNVEDMKERENVNSYVHGMLKRRLHMNKKRGKAVTPKCKKVPPKTEEDSPHQKLFKEFIQQQQSDSENEEDSEVEEDYYWEEA